MTKVAVVFAEGFEEIEALSPVDVFRRAGFDCNMLGLESASVTGSHGIQVAMDGVFDGNFTDYDLVVLPGGMPGSTNSHVSLVLKNKLHLASIKLTWLLLTAILSLAVVPEQH